MKKDFAIGCLLAVTMATGAFAATTVLTAAPTESWTVTNYYKQAVYDPKESKIGDIDDVLVDKSGKITGFVIRVGGFLDAGEKDVIVPFTAVKTAKKNDKWLLTLDETKDDLKGRTGLQVRSSQHHLSPGKQVDGYAGEPARFEVHSPGPSVSVLRSLRHPVSRSILLTFLAQAAARRRASPARFLIARLRFRSVFSIEAHSASIASARCSCLRIPGMVIRRSRRW